MKQKKQFTLDNFIYHLWKIIILIIIFYTIPTVIFNALILY
jgi:hypothetical protein